MDLRILSDQPEAIQLTALRARTDGQLIALITGGSIMGCGPVLPRRMPSEFTGKFPSYCCRKFRVSSERRRLETKLARLGASLHSACASVA